MYIPFQVNRFYKSILLLVKYKFVKVSSKDFILQNLILLTRSCGTAFITQHSWLLQFRQQKSAWWKWFVPAGYHFPRGILPGPALRYFCMIHRGGQLGGGDPHACTGWRRPWDAVTCRSLSAKEPIIIGLFCGKWPIKIRYPMGLGDLVAVDTCLLLSKCSLYIYHVWCDTYEYELYK